MPESVTVRARRIDTRWPSLIVRVAIGVVFLVSGFTKIGDVDGTIRTVRAYRLLPEAIAPAVGSGLPILELVLALVLLAGLLTRPVAAVTGLLSLAFFIGVASAWARGLHIECGCFGNNGASPHPVPGYIRELVLNGLIMLGVAWLLRFPASRFSLDHALGLSTDDLDWSTPEQDAEADEAEPTESADETPASAAAHDPGPSLRGPDGVVHGAGGPENDSGPSGPGPGEGVHRLGGVAHGSGADPSSSSTSSAPIGVDQ